MVKEFPRRVDRVMLRPRSMGGFLGGIFWLEALLERDLGPFDLILPMVPGARQDRMNATGDALFTAKSVARIINSLRLPHVVIVDPHSDVTPGLIDRCSVIHQSSLLPIDVRDRNYAAVISPDAGAEKKAAAVAKRIGVPLVHGWKTRDVSTGQISGFGVSELPDAGSRLLIVDDICDGGGTFLGLAKAIRERGPYVIDLHVTHGLFTQGTAALLDVFDRVSCTDSIAKDRPGIAVSQPCLNLLTEGARP
ncbi:MAG: ribose-phosphate pyrophosphokinase [Phenylobacterium sp.]|uniref:phosphoribosyltransferase family protein n=1 Tax=Phenylobacterium sp. TaxID=1871053 RepID=UPI00120DA7BE|nr:phosphoribosyltransferase family protein [Phenylobacterium sp.]TAL29063.1 MAG: ribose-phosphate pyrophosphokinase [Phenylobacterium sp.]